MHGPAISQLWEANQRGERKKGEERREKGSCFRRPDESRRVDAHSHTFWPHVSHTLRASSVSMTWVERRRDHSKLFLWASLSLFGFSFFFVASLLPLLFFFPRRDTEWTLGWVCRLFLSRSHCASVSSLNSEWVSHTDRFIRLVVCCVMRNVSLSLSHFPSAGTQSQESGKKKCSKLPRMCLIKLQDATDDSSLLSQDANKTSAYRSERGEEKMLPSCLCVCVCVCSGDLGFTWDTWEGSRSSERAPRETERERERK